VVEVLLIYLTTHDYEFSTQGLVLDRQRQMNEERAENGGFSLPDFSFPEGGSGGGLPEINLEGLSEFSLDPVSSTTIKL